MFLNPRASTLFTPCHALLIKIRLNFMIFDNSATQSNAVRFDFNNKEL